ncbi:MAG: RT0821/Lpp0805 family surface protein [Burkholderiales bacterium]
MKVIALLVTALSLLLPGAANAQILNELAASPISRFSAADNKLLLSAIDKALADKADGAALAWKSDTSPARGSVTPRRTFESDGAQCRDLLIANEYRSRNAQSVHTFCRDSAGAWKLRS